MSNITVDPGIQRFLWQGTGLAVEEERAPLQQQRRDRLHPVDGLRARIFVDIELDDLEPPLALFRDALQHRRDGVARAAPRRPEVDQDRDRAVLDLALPSRV